MCVSDRGNGWDAGRFGNRVTYYMNEMRIRGGRRAAKRHVGI